MWEISSLDVVLRGVIVYIANSLTSVLLYFFLNNVHFKYTSCSAGAETIVYDSGLLLLASLV